MPDLPRSQEQQRAETARSNASKRSQARAPDRAAETWSARQPVMEAADSGAAAAAAGKSAVRAGQAKTTAGSAGELDLRIVWIDAWVGNDRSCRFDVTSLPGHRLEVTVEQLVYCKTYTGQGTVSTVPVPVAPIGTQIKVTARDTDTGETLEARGHWVSLGGWLARLWEAIKRSLWKGGAA
jgi:hypothetical protein